MAVERITVTGEGSSIKVLVRTTPAAGVSDADVAAAIAAAVLDDLADVTSPSPGDGQVLTWDAGTSRWVPAAAAGGAVDSVNGHTGTVVLGAADVGAAPSARTLVAGVGLSGGGDLSVDRTFDVDYGTTAGTAAEGDDVRLSDARTPTAHHASHENGGADELALDASQVTSGTVGTARLGTGTADNTTYLRGDQTWAAVTPGASALNDLTDVDTVTDPPATDDVLAWDGSLWTPAGLTAADTGAIPETLIDAKGDLVVGTANDTAARLGVGSNGQVLTADSGEASGVKWTSDFLPLVANGASVEDVGAIESNVNTVAATGSTETLDLSLYAFHDCTMDQACTFTFSNPAPSGKATIFTLILRGAFTPTLPASIKWAGGAPTYTTPSQYVFTTVDGGTTYLGQQVGAAFA